MVNSNTFKPNNPASASAAPQAGAGKNSPQSLPVQIAGTGDEVRGQIILDTTRTCLDVLQQQGITEPGRISATIINAVADELEIPIMMDAGTLPACRSTAHNARHQKDMLSGKIVRPGL